MTITSSGLGSVPIRTFNILDRMITIMGSTKTTFFPFLESHGGSRVEEGIHSYKENEHNLFARDETNVAKLDDDFSPYRHVGGVYSYDFYGADEQYLVGTDDSNLGFPSNADFSVGAFIWPRDITAVTIMGKYDANVQREWRLSLDSSSKIELEAFDETNNGDRTGASDTAVTADEWSFVCVTTNNNDADTAMAFYLNGTADGSGNTETGTHVSMPDTTALFTIGVTLNTGPATTAAFDGRIALPFVCGKILTAANVTELNALGTVLLGL